MHNRIPRAGSPAQAPLFAPQEFNRAYFALLLQLCEAREKIEKNLHSGYEGGGFRVNVCVEGGGASVECRRGRRVIGVHLKILGPVWIQCMAHWIKNVCWIRQKQRRSRGPCVRQICGHGLPRKRQRNRRAGHRAEALRGITVAASQTWCQRLVRALPPVPALPARHDGID